MNAMHRPASMVMVAVVAGLLGCSEPVSDIETVPGRWYTADQVQQGRTLFLSHCASCHGEQAQGTAEWRTLGEDGNYPPPPLNGSAHAWHHPIEVLERAIADGGARIGGVMPGFAGTLDARETRAAIAYFQSHWSDDIYARWEEIDAR